MLLSSASRDCARLIALRIGVVDFDSGLGSLLWTRLGSGIIVWVDIVRIVRPIVRHLRRVVILLRPVLGSLEGVCVGGGGVLGPDLRVLILLEYPGVSPRGPLTKVQW
jgi:hypothetical protein